MISSTQHESLSPERIHVRALCHCCGGGERRKGLAYTKAKSRKLSLRAAKPKGKDHERGAKRFWFEEE